MKWSNVPGLFVILGTVAFIFRGFAFIITLEDWQAFLVMVAFFVIVAILSYAIHSLLYYLGEKENQKEESHALKA